MPDAENKIKSRKEGNIEMKILIASDTYFTVVSGLAEMTFTEAETLRELGNDVRVLCLSPDRKSRKQGMYYMSGSFSLPIYPGYRQSLKFKDPILDELKEWKPDIVHCQTEGTVHTMAKSIAKAAGAPLVMTLHTNYTQFIFHNAGQAGSAFSKVAGSILAPFIYKGTAVITTPSEKARNILVDDYHVRTKVCVVPNGIKQDIFKKPLPDEERKAILAKYDIPDNGKLFVCISRISAEKNIRELIDFFPDVLAEEGDAYLLMVGDGPYLKAAKKRAEKNGVSDRIIFTGVVNRQEIYKYYKLGEAFLSASVFEMHSLTYIEAITCGLPLICRNDTSLKGLLDDGVNGFIYNDREEFKQGCLKIIRDKELAGRMSDDSLERSKRFTDKAHAGNMQRLYLDILKKKKEHEAGL